MNPYAQFYRNVLWIVYLPTWIPIVGFVYLMSFVLESFNMALDWWTAAPWRRA